jgi:hypothetical protein
MTNDVPGANPVNADKLDTGCWAEHDDGSLIFIKGVEGDQVVYEIYDLATDPPVYYQDAMREAEFKKAFSAAPVGTSKDTWKWHDKSAFPWGKVMKTFDKPRPVNADVHDILSAAARVAQSLRLRAQKLTPSDVKPSEEQELPKAGQAIVERIQKAIGVLFGG